jgi:peptidoglycan hydrolase CwlO-like protein
MSPDNLKKEIHSIQKEIEENEKKFDAALQDAPSQVELAKTIYKNIKVLEDRLTTLNNLLGHESGLP